MRQRRLRQELAVISGQARTRHGAEGRPMDRRPDSVEDTPKSHRARSEPLSDQAMAALDELSGRRALAGPDDPVLGAKVGGDLNDDDVRAAFYAAPAVAELGRLRTKAEPIVFRAPGPACISDA